jgi:hypothetical protein
MEIFDAGEFERSHGTDPGSQVIEASEAWPIRVAGTHPRPPTMVG